MSGTISIVPLALYAIMEIAGIVTPLTSSLMDALDEQKEAVKKQLRDGMKQSAKDSFTQNAGFMKTEDVQNMCREYETVFMDESILEKTLKEHGIENFTNENGKISCRIGNFTVDFYREENRPYLMNISCNHTCNTDELLSDISSEYAQNVQEESYVKIKERLSRHNLKIDKEEILDDDSIMITVNLE